MSARLSLSRPHTPSAARTIWHPAARANLDVPTTSYLSPPPSSGLLVVLHHHHHHHHIAALLVASRPRLASSSRRGHPSTPLLRAAAVATSAEPRLAAPHRARARPPHASSADLAISGSGRWVPLRAVRPAENPLPPAPRSTSTPHDFLAELHTGSWSFLTSYWGEHTHRKKGEKRKVSMV
ncbi:unnamed protein product [Urochloa humidicola]